MDVAAALAFSMIVVFFFGVLSIILGSIIYYNTKATRMERLGKRIGFIGGIGFISLALIGWFIAIWTAFAQSAGAS